MGDKILAESRKIFPEKHFLDFVFQKILLCPQVDPNGGKIVKNKNLPFSPNHRKLSQKKCVSKFCPILGGGGCGGKLLAIVDSPTVIPFLGLVRTIVLSRWIRLQKMLHKGFLLSIIYKAIAEPKPKP